MSHDLLICPYRVPHMYCASPTCPTSNKYNEKSDSCLAVSVACLLTVACLVIHVSDMSPSDVLIKHVPKDVLVVTHIVQVSMANVCICSIANVAKASKCINTYHPTTLLEFLTDRFVLSSNIGVSGVGSVLSKKQIGFFDKHRTCIIYMTQYGPNQMSTGKWQNLSQLQTCSRRIVEIVI